MGAPWGPKIAEWYTCRTPEVTFWALGRPKPRFVDLLPPQNIIKKHKTFQHRPKTSQNSLTINFRTPKVSKSDFGGSARVPFSDFGPPGRPHYQRSKYISI